MLKGVSHVVVAFLIHLYDTSSFPYCQQKNLLLLHHQLGDLPAVVGPGHVVVGAVGKALGSDVINVIVGSARKRQVQLVKAGRRFL